MRRPRPVFGLFALLALWTDCESPLHGQDDPAGAAAEAEQNQPPSEAIVIPDEPRTIDPAHFVPEPLAIPVTVDFEETAIEDVAAWIRDELGYPTLIDEAAIRDLGILLSDPITERLDDAPAYLLLNRLRQMQLGWFVEDDILRITTKEFVDERLSTVQYNIGNLLDAGYEDDAIRDVIARETSGPWFDVDGLGGSLQILGDVLFVRQTYHVQREVAAVLAALAEHGRMTLLLESPQNLALRDQLDANVTADFDRTPLQEAIENLAAQVDIDMRLDVQALSDIGIRDRQPVSLTLSGRPLSTTLEVLLSGIHLTYLAEDGVMWITSRETVEDRFTTAIYDVRDLCRDQQESAALQEAIQEQTRGPWFDIDGVGGTVNFPKPGVMVVRQTQAGLYELLNLLETYRAALRASKPRPRNEIDPNEYIVTYYRMPSEMAADLVSLLPVLVKPETWRSDDHPDAQGYAMVAASGVELRDVHGRTVVAPKEANEKDSRALVVSQSVLIVSQSRENHEEVKKVIRRVREGDSQTGDSGGFTGGGGGFGGGGFGGGFFSTPPAAHPAPPTHPQPATP